MWLELMTLKLQLLLLLLLLYTVRWQEFGLSFTDFTPSSSTDDTTGVHGVFWQLVSSSAHGSQHAAAACLLLHQQMTEKGVKTTTLVLAGK
jgi:hypothetical protein